LDQALQIGDLHVGNEKDIRHRIALKHFDRF
jgi:hypothetical protein